MCIPNFQSRISNLDDREDGDKSWFNKLYKVKNVKDSLTACQILEYYLFFFIAINNIISQCYHIVISWANPHVTFLYVTESIKLSKRSAIAIEFFLSLFCFPWIFQFFVTNSSFFTCTNIQNLQSLTNRTSSIIIDKW